VIASHNRMTAMLLCRGNCTEEYLMPHNLISKISVGLLSTAVTRFDLSENAITELPRSWAGCQSWPFWCSQGTAFARFRVNDACQE
jgi:hypothetical protein